MEYRRYKRVPARLTLLIYRRGALVATGMLRNISKSGLFISTHGPDLDLDQEVEIEFNLHGRHTSGSQRIRAKLVHQTPTGIGAQFAGGGDKESPVLRALLSWVKETNLLIGRPRTEQAAAL
ncbi:PilZ domain-containing protein [Marinobacter zhejiangensis]|uniref:PilZ domain-containing protein n=1 Tax=Marinobacter zhejiangensis TaxID=488535 RepID=A0A1I4RZ43_9GAMM|nr:PilZ domain-containing protein [Marinobacter zhejiangensis]